MKVTDILRVKGNTLFTITPDDLLAEAVNTMADKDIGSLVVMEHGDLVGMLTFREVIVAIVGNGGQVGGTQVRKAMDDAPVTCTLETDLDEIRRIMLERHAALHAGDGQAHADGRDQLLRRGQGRGRRAELREQDAQGLYPRLAARKTRRTEAPQRGDRRGQWMAAYMIASCVASVAENSVTTLPCLATRMRSDSAITSGR